MTRDDPAILLASAGDAFPPNVLARVRQLAGDARPPVVVISVARIWGTALGLPHPGLYPTRQEMEAQWALVEEVAGPLTGDGFPVRTAVLRARKAGKAIARFAEKADCRVIVIAAPDATRWRRMLFGDVPAEISRRTAVPVEPVRGPDQHLHRAETNERPDAHRFRLKTVADGHRPRGYGPRSRGVGPRDGGRDAMARPP
jgi:nucleotide-binding universal stress UspA family protein